MDSRSKTENHRPRFVAKSSEHASVRSPVLSFSNVTLNEVFSFISHLDYTVYNDMMLQHSRHTRHLRSTTRRPHTSSEFIYLSPIALFSIVLCLIYATLLCRLTHNAGLLHVLAPVVFVVVLCLDFPSRIGTTSISF